MKNPKKNNIFYFLLLNINLPFKISVLVVFGLIMGNYVDTRHSFYLYETYIIHSRMWNYTEINWNIEGGRVFFFFEKIEKKVKSPRDETGKKFEYKIIFFGILQH